MWGLSTVSFNESQTIAAIATAQGLGGIGIVRVSGDDAIEICNRIFKSITLQENKILNAKGYTAHYGNIFSDGESIDDSILTVYRKPHSYTGEDVVEISCHGGLYMTKKILETVIENGARLAQAGEFTKRAFLNGKIGLTEAESVMDIIAANGKSSARAAQAAKDGALEKKINAVKEKLLDLAAQLSAWADYPDEDVVEVSEQSIKEVLEKCKLVLENLLKTYDAGKILKEGIYTVIVGRPNVGKSTLMNCLSGHERSIVTNIPGTTRDIIEESILLGDVYMRIADTAGIRDTSDKIEAIGVDRAKQQIKSADLILAVFDASNEFTQDDLDLIDSLENFNTIAIVNKVDLGLKSDINFLKSKLKNVIKLSAIEGTGLDVLEKVIKDLVGLTKIDPSEAILANERQKDSAKEAFENIIEAINSLAYGMTFDAVTVLIEGAIDALMSLTGERVSEKVVDRVFEKFCVGK